MLNFIKEQFKPKEITEFKPLSPFEWVWNKLEERLAIFDSKNKKLEAKVQQGLTTLLKNFHDLDDKVKTLESIINSTTITLEEETKSPTVKKKAKYPRGWDKPEEVRPMLRKQNMRRNKVKFTRAEATKYLELPKYRLDKVSKEVLHFELVNKDGRQRAIYHINDLNYYKTNVLDKGNRK